jgi:hypothetical protein
MKRLSFWALALLLLASAGWQLGAAAQQPGQTTPTIDPASDAAFFNAFRWRSIGPDRGGRSIAVTGVKGRPKEAYFGAAGGGLWKTTDGGATWAPVTDGQITSSSVGAVAVSESNPDIVYIGMGEACIRGNIMPGDGVYKSIDAGKTWTRVGFTASDAIAKIRIHPTNPDVVFVAELPYTPTGKLLRRCRWTVGAEPRSRNEPRQSQQQQEPGQAPERPTRRRAFDIRRGELAGRCARVCGAVAPECSSGETSGSAPCPGARFHCRVACAYD